MTINYSKQVLLKRGNSAVSSAYVGPLGEVTVDTDFATIRVHDGVTPGGHLSTSSASSDTPPENPRESTLWYDTISGRLYVYYAGAWIDASPAGDVLLNANVANLSAQVTGLTSDVANVEIHIASLDANIGAFESNVTSTVGTINANINTLNQTIADFEANAGPTSDAWVDDAPPDISNVGALWYDADGGRLYVYYDSTWVDASPTTVDLGKFIFDTDLDRAFISTTNDAGGRDGYDIVLVPGGEGYSSITIPRSANAANGAPLVIGATDANSAVQISTDAGDWIFGNTGTTTFPTGGRISATKGGTALDAGYGYNTSLTTFYANANYAACVTGDAETGTLYITAYNNGGPSPAKEWAFDKDGNLTLPAGGNLVTSTGSLHTISLDLLKSIVASSVTWEEFQANVAAL